MSAQSSAVANFRQWDQAHWRTFFKNSELSGVSYKDDALLRGPEFQETMMKVGVFGDARLFDETPCIWDCETNLGNGCLWHFRAPEDKEGVTCLATKVLGLPDQAGEEDEPVDPALEKDDMPLGTHGVVIQAGDFDPIVFVKRETRWYAPCLLGGQLGANFYSIVDPAHGIFRTFDRAAETFEQEKTQKARIKDLLTPLLFPPVAELVCIYASNLARDKRSHEKRELRNLTYWTFEKAAQNLLPEDQRGFWHLRTLLNVDRTKLKIISASIVQYMGDHEEESSS